VVNFTTLLISSNVSGNSVFQKSILY